MNSGKIRTSGFDVGVAPTASVAELSIAMTLAAGYPGSRMVSRSPGSSMPHAIGFACMLALTSVLGGCTIDGVAILPGFEPNEFGDESGEGEDDDGTQGNDSSNGDDDGLELPGDDGGEAELACEVLVGELDAALPCGVEPPSDHLAPKVAWTWTGPDGEDSVLVTPLVGNLDDDTYDDAINPCDRPEVIVLAVDAPNNGKHLPAGHLYVLDSTTGELKWKIDRPVDASATPALADLDDDGVPEILAFERSEEMIGQAGERRVVAFEADGTVAWLSDTWVKSTGGGGGLAIADLDADGSPEILAPEHVLSADGTLLWAPPSAPQSDSLPVAADLDGDGMLEVLFGGSVYEYDGTERFELLQGDKNTGVSAIANFDDDDEPEIYVHRGKHRVYEHDGTPKVECGDNVGNGKDLPITIADTNADGRAEILSNAGDSFEALTITTDPDGEATCEQVWSVPSSDGGGSAFDFLADGSAEAIYSDLDWVRIYNTEDKTLTEFSRTARPSMANPVVADADNDGAAELIVVGSEPENSNDEASRRVSVLFIENDDDRFAPTRRIWNQHAYHATNVSEDARVPVQQEPHWHGPNGFRTNPAPSYRGNACQMPVIE
jgi:outer membrane protein assembly factor BamB